VPGNAYLPPKDDYNLGDLIRDVPSLHVPSRPFQVVRKWQPSKEDPSIWDARIHTEGGSAPHDGFKWTLEGHGDSIIARGIVHWAVLLSDDCEMEHDEDHRTMALVKPWDNLPETSQKKVSEGEHYCFFELLAQTEDPKWEHSYVDFRRLTTVKPRVLDKAAHHYASASPELRKALATRFWEYLMRHAAEEAKA
jgi:hypothetical protein